jgi:hypothetical protein
MAEYLGLSITVILAICSWLVTYFHAYSSKIYDAKLAHLDAQIKHLYGPVYASLMSGAAVWEAFHKKYWPDRKTYFDGNQDAKDEELWRIWIQAVFLPIHKEVKSTIVANVDLFRGNEIPPVAIELLAHIHAYEAIIMRWERGDYTEHVYATTFPVDALPHFKKELEALLKERAKLRGERRRRRSKAA